MLRLAGDTPEADRICQRMIALHSLTLGIQTPPEEAEISEINVSTDIQGKQRLYRKEIGMHSLQMPPSPQGLILTRCHRQTAAQTAALQCPLPPATPTSLLGLSTPAFLFTSQGTATPLCLSTLTLARTKLTTQPESGMLVDE